MAIVRNASILFICTMTGNFSNYCFQFLMGRSLAIEDYGTMNALLSVTMSITLPTSAIMFVVAKYSSTYLARGHGSGLSSLYRTALRRVSAAAAAVSAGFLIASPQLAGYLNVESVTPVALLAVGIAGSFLMTVNLGMHQGMQRFLYLGAGLGLGGVLRLVLGGGFVLAGAGLNGAILATVVPAVIIFAITFVPLSVLLGDRGEEFRHERIMRYSVPVVISTSAFAFLSNIDLILVKHFLAPAEAGIYASVAVLGKTMLYLPSAFALAVFPMVSESTELNGDSFKILDKSLACTAALSAGGLVLFAAFPDVIIGVLFGERFLAAAPYLVYYGGAMSMMAVVSILISFNLARSKTGFIYSLAMASVLVVALIHRFHSGPAEVMAVLVGVFFLLTAHNLALVYRERRLFYRLRNGVAYEAAETTGPEC